MDALWSMSTTLRNPERIKGILTAISDLEGEPWTNSTQERLQILLIKQRQYKPLPNGLSNNQRSILNDSEHQITFDEASSIFYAKHYEDPPMRGRTSFDPIEKLGLASVSAVPHRNTKVIRITAFGRMFLDNKITLDEVVLTSFLKLELPNPINLRGYSRWNSKPFINGLRLISRVNELCVEKGLKPVGVNRDEFGIFLLSLKNYKKVDRQAKALLSYRAAIRKITGRTQNDAAKKQMAYREEYISAHLSEFKGAIKNTREYADNIIRYFRLTKFVRERGNGYYIDLEPCRMNEINALLEADKGKCGSWTAESWTAYISDFASYKIPWETPTILKKILLDTEKDVHNLEKEFKIPLSEQKPVKDAVALKAAIAAQRERRLTLQNIKNRLDFKNPENITDVIKKLEQIHKTTGKPSIMLEQYVTLGLNVLDDAESIKPNAPMGDDNVPTFTAPAGVPDIECRYNDFNAICEVTMLKDKSQWHNEGFSVQRHLHEYVAETGIDRENCYCLFIAPLIKEDTLDSFFVACKYQYRGRPIKVFPITIADFIKLLKKVQALRKSGGDITHADIRSLYSKCTEMEEINDSSQWRKAIQSAIDNWLDI